MKVLFLHFEGKKRVKADFLYIVEFRTKVDQYKSEKNYNFGIKVYFFGQKKLKLKFSNLNVKGRLAL